MSPSLWLARLQFAGGETEPMKNSTGSVYTGIIAIIDPQRLSIIIPEQSEWLMLSEMSLTSLVPLLTP